MKTRILDPRKLVRRRLGERGQAIIEFAMVVPLLAILVLIFVSFGKALYYYIDLTQVAAEGARQASVQQPASGFSGLKTALCDQLGTGSELNTGSGTVSAAKITVSYPAGTQNVGDPVTVQVSTHYNWFLFMNLGSIPITGSATMRLEQPLASGYGANSGTC